MKLLEDFFNITGSRTE